MAGVKGRSGGAREGAGRPKKTPAEYSLLVKDRVLEAAEKLKAKHGYSIEEAILGIVYEEGTNSNARVSAANFYKEILVIKESKQEKTITETKAPTVYVPERKEDPALKLLKKDEVVNE